MEYAVELRNVSKWFGDHRALTDCSLTVKSGEFVTLLGASGCGKTTTIRIIAGHLTQTAGQVFIHGRDVSFLPPQKREVGMVFQDYALFPHLTVRENIAFGLRVRRWGRARRSARVDELLAMTGLGDAGAKKPRELSGGMQQRVAVARALAFEPQIMLMDEPLAALDVKLRESMQAELLRLQRDVGVTTIYVTHDQQEAMRMSDRIVVMEHGQIRQIGNPREIYTRPGSRFVADFVGASNLLHGKAEVVSPSNLAIRVGRALVHARPVVTKLGASMTLVVRPEVVHVGDDAAALSASNHFQGVVEEAAFMGSSVRLTLAVPALGTLVMAQVAPEREWEPGETVDISWKPEAAVPLPERGSPAVGTATADSPVKPAPSESVAGTDPAATKQSEPYVNR
jgi:ABC-type Fe3+/spermidine/putrescine transport system ATPase subunit